MHFLHVGEDTELTTSNKPKEQFFEWFLNPLLVIKEQIKAEDLSVSEQDYFGKVVLFNGDPTRVEKSFIGSRVPESDRKRAELHALARRYISNQITLVVCNNCCTNFPIRIFPPLFFFFSCIFHKDFKGSPNSSQGSLPTRGVLMLS